MGGWVGWRWSCDGGRTGIKVGIHCMIVLMGDREGIGWDPFVQDIGKTAWTGSASLFLRLSDGRSRGEKHYWLAVCVIRYFVLLRCP